MNFFRNCKEKSLDDSTTLLSIANSNFDTTFIAYAENPTVDVDTTLTLLEDSVDIQSACPIEDHRVIQTNNPSASLTYDDTLLTVVYGNPINLQFQ